MGGWTEVLVRLTLLISALALLAAPAAKADMTVQFTAAVSPSNEANVTINDDALAPQNDVVTITQTALSFVISRSGGGLIQGGGCTVGPGAAITCPRAPSVEIDLAGGDDTLNTNSVTASLLIAGG